MFKNVTFQLAHVNKNVKETNETSLLTSYFNESIFCQATWANTHFFSMKRMIFSQCYYECATLDKGRVLSLTKGGGLMWFKN